MLFRSLAPAIARALLLILVATSVAAPARSALAATTEPDPSCSDALGSQAGAPEEVAGEPIAADALPGDPNISEPSPAPSAPAPTEADRAERRRHLLLQARGYALMAIGMAGSLAALNALSKQYPDLAFFFGSLAGAAAAPFVEPVTSRFRHLLFGMRSATAPQAKAATPLEAQWVRTQEALSINSQMSRNVISQFLTTMPAFHQALAEIRSRDPEAGEAYAAAVVADAAVRMRRLFPDLAPNQPDVARAVRAAFTEHVPQARKLLPRIVDRIEEMDPEMVSGAPGAPGANEYYIALLRAWIL